MFSSRAMSSRVGQPVSNNRLPIFRARTSSRVRLVSAGVAFVTPWMMHFLAIIDRMRFLTRIVLAIVEESSGQSRRINVKVNSIRMDLRSDDDGAQQVVQRFSRQAVPSSGERGRGIRQPFLGGRTILALRDRIEDFDRIGKEGSHAADDERFKI